MTEKGTILNFKTLLSSVALLFVGATAQAQFLHVVTTDGTRYEFKAENIAQAYVDNEADIKEINGYEYVDLGTGVKWATMNVGAKTATGVGNYYGWGEKEVKSTFAWNKYSHSNGPSSDYINKYTVDDEQVEGQWYDNDGEYIGDNKVVLDAEDDVANVVWGKPWRMPTPEDFAALMANCYAVVVSEYAGVNKSGIVVYKRLEKDNTVKTASNFYKSACPDDYNTSTCTHIFLPCGGYKKTSTTTSAANGYYWSNSLVSAADLEMAETYMAASFMFNPTKKTASYETLATRYYGYQVRPVAD